MPKQIKGVVYDIFGSEYLAYASREVILSAGAVPSPQLLEFTGIGQPKLLKNHGIEIAHKLEGVGHGFVKTRPELATPDIQFYSLPLALTPPHEH